MSTAWACHLYSSSPDKTVFGHAPHTVRPRPALAATRVGGGAKARVGEGARTHSNASLWLYHGEGSGHLARKNNRAGRNVTGHTRSWSHVRRTGRVTEEWERCWSVERVVHVCGHDATPWLASAAQPRHCASHGSGEATRGRRRRALTGAAVAAHRAYTPATMRRAGCGAKCRGVVPGRATADQARPGGERTTSACVGQRGHQQGFPTWGPNGTAAYGKRRSSVSSAVAYPKEGMTLGFCGMPSLLGTHIWMSLQISSSS